MKNAVVTDEEFELPEDFEFESRCKDGNFGAVISKKLNITKLIADGWAYVQRFVGRCSLLASTLGGRPVLAGKLILHEMVSTNKLKL